MVTAAQKLREEKAGAHPVLDVPCEFNSVTFGDATANVGIAIQRERVNLDAAEGAFCGKRLTGRILVTAGDDPDQQYFDGMKAQHVVAGVFDCKGFRVSPKWITTAATFALEGLEIEELAHFAKRSGRIVVSLIQGLEPASKLAAPGGGDDEDEEDGEAEE